MFKAFNAFFCCFLFMFLLAGDAFARVSAITNVIAVPVGGTLELNIKSEGEKNAFEPDLRELRRSFKIVNQRKLVRSAYINGVASMLTEWNLLISPKDKNGSVVIPAIAVGKEKTNPITVQILSTSQKKSLPKVGAAKDISEDVFVKVDVENENPYVQSQVIYVARLYSSYKIAEGALISPIMDNAIVERLGEDIDFTTTINGKAFKVIERKFAIFPQISGEIVVPPAEFSGTIISGAGNPVNDVFNQMAGGMSVSATLSMFGMTRPVKVLSDSMTINVLPKPKEAVGKWWLPAYAFRVSESWEPNPPVFKENEAVTRTIKIEAAGLTAAQLPDVPLPDDEYLKVYPGKVEVKNNSSDKGIIGISQKSMVLIPTAAGKLVLPEIKIEWWNVPAKRMETAIIPAHEITVKGNIKRNNPQTAINNNANTASNINEASDNKIKIERIDSENSNLMLLIGGFGGFFIALVLLFVFRRRSMAMVAALQQQEDDEDKGNNSSRNLVVEKGGSAAGGVNPNASLNNASSLSFIAKAHAHKSNNKKDAGKTVKNLRQAMAELEKTAKENNPKKLQTALLEWGRMYFKGKSLLNISDIAKFLESKKLQKELEELNQSLYAKANADFKAENIIKALHEALAQHKAEEKKIKPVPDLYPDMN